MHRYRSQYVLLLILPPDEHEFLRWLMEIDPMRNTSYMSQNNYSRMIQGNETAHVRNKNEE